MIDRRRYERVQFLCEVELTALSNGSPVQARSLDISLGGVGLITQTSFEPGQIIALAFHLKDTRGREVVEKVVGKVVHLRADADGNRVGVEFLEPLHDSTQPRLMAKLEKI